MGKPEGAQVVKPRGPQKSPISKTWISMWNSGEQEQEKDANLVAVVLAFILCGGLLFELLKLFF
jgi:hypothetical protein